MVTNSMGSPARGGGVVELYAKSTWFGLVLAIVIFSAILSGLNPRYQLLTTSLVIFCVAFPAFVICLNRRVMVDMEARTIERRVYFLDHQVSVKATDLSRYTDVEARTCRTRPGHEEHGGACDVPLFTELKFKAGKRWKRVVSIEYGWDDQPLVAKLLQDVAELFPESKLGEELRVRRPR